MEWPPDMEVSCESNKQLWTNSNGFVRGEVSSDAGGTSKTLKAQQQTCYGANMATFKISLVLVLGSRNTSICNW